MAFTPPTFTLPTPPWGWTLFPKAYHAFVTRQLMWNAWTEFGTTYQDYISCLLMTSDFEYDPDMETVIDCVGSAPGFANEITNPGPNASGPASLGGWSGKYNRNAGFVGGVLSDYSPNLTNRSASFDSTTGHTLLKADPFGWRGVASSPATYRSDNLQVFREPLVNVPDLKYALLYLRGDSVVWDTEDTDPGNGYLNSMPIAVMDLGYQNPKFVEGVTSESDRFKFSGSIGFFFKDCVVLRVPGKAV